MHEPPLTLLPPSLHLSSARGPTSTASALHESEGPGDWQDDENVRHDREGGARCHEQRPQGTRNGAQIVQDSVTLIMMISLISPILFLWHSVLLDVLFPRFRPLLMPYSVGLKCTWYAVLLFSAQIAAFLCTYRVLEIYKLRF